jgi:hypothetical protein
MAATEGAIAATGVSGLGKGVSYPELYTTEEGLRKLGSHLRSLHGVKVRSGIEHDKRVEYFKGIIAVSLIPFLPPLMSLREETHRMSSGSSKLAEIFAEDHREGNGSGVSSHPLAKRIFPSLGEECRQERPPHRKSSTSLPSRASQQRWLRSLPRKSSRRRGTSPGCSVVA